MSKANKLREFMKKVRVWPKSCKKELAQACGLKGRDLRYTLRDFLRRGEIIEDGNNLRYVGLKNKGLLIDKVWKAWRYTPTWTVHEIARLTDVSPETIRSYVKKYKKLGLVEQVGRRPVPTGFGYEAIYRLKSKERRRPC